MSPVLAALLEFDLLERAIYELGWELNRRSERVWVPLLDILELLGLEARPSGRRSKWWSD